MFQSNTNFYYLWITNMNVIPCNQSLCTFNNIKVSCQVSWKAMRTVGKMWKKTCLWQFIIIQYFYFSNCKYKLSYHITTFCIIITRIILFKNENIYVNRFYLPKHIFCVLHDMNLASQHKAYCIDNVNNYYTSTKPSTPKVNKSQPGNTLHSGCFLATTTVNVHISLSLPLLIIWIPEIVAHFAKPSSKA